MSRRILVTGGAGFIGSHLCARLVREGHEVLCADNFFTGRRGNVAELLDSRNFELLRHDVTFPLYVEVDEIYNLACPASPLHYQFDPVQTAKTSVVGAINMLGLAKRLRVPILQASTSEVYGDPQVHPQTEGYWGHVNPIGPRSCYDEGKRCAETLFFDYRRQHNVPIKVVRIFNTYGPNMNSGDGRVVSNFIVSALRGENITIYGDGNQTRSFCYVTDLLEGLTRTMATSPDVTGPINLGNPVEFTIAELAELVVQLTGTRSRIVHTDLPADDPRQRRPDISRARELLGWEPQIQLREGLERTIVYFEQILAEPSDGLPARVQQAATRKPRRLGRRTAPFRAGSPKDESVERSGDLPASG
jgi:UDP-glucuronate decarboxylase